MIIFVSSTRYGLIKFYRDTPLGQFLTPAMHAEIELSNTHYGLSMIYNDTICRVLPQTNDGDIFLFLHDDVSIQDSDLEGKLNTALQKFDIVGLAGTSSLVMGNHVMWHTSPKEDHSGAVAHPYGVGQIAMKSFGPMPRRCVAIDGLFMAIRAGTLRKHRKVRFDDQFDFYYYDLDFCLTAHKASLTIGTWPIWVVHQSPGLRSWDNPTWQAARDKFLAKWGETPFYFV